MVSNWGSSLIWGIISMSFSVTSPFDFVIGSSHIVHGSDPYYPEFFRGTREADCYMEYFESILENLTFFSEMDVYGHIDYIVRYGRTKTANTLTDVTRISWTKYSSLLSVKNIGIELNTPADSHYGLGEPIPVRIFIRALPGTQRRDHHRGSRRPRAP